MVNIRKYQPGDEKSFLSLDAALEEHPWNRRNLFNWQWKFKGDNPAGEGLIYIAEEKNEMIAHFAAIPMKYWINGKYTIASHSIAMMVKPEWQNRGLINFVAEKLLQNLEYNKIPFTYGYPNKNSYEMHIKYLNYSCVAMQKLYYRKINLNQKYEIKNKYKFFKILRIKKFNASVDDLWERIKCQYVTAVVRNSNFLNWRYMKRPDHIYYAFGLYANYDKTKLLGYYVLKLYQEDKLLRGHIIDIALDYSYSELAGLLIETALNFFIEKQAYEITLWMQGSKYMQAIFQYYGFYVKDARPLICRFNSYHEKYQLFLNENNWYFTMGDTLEIY